LGPNTRGVAAFVHFVAEAHVPVVVNRFQALMHVYSSKKKRGEQSSANQAKKAQTRNSDENGNYKKGIYGL
jgi:hypothetical protein